jgi:phage terminase large subunit
MDLHREIAYAPSESQLNFHDLTTKFKGFSGPVGSGKSYAFCQEALRLAYANPGCQGLIGAPTYPMLRDVTQTAFFELLEANRVPFTFRRAANICYLHEPEAEILFRTMDQPERLRGLNLAWFGVDELTYCKEDAWKRLEARIREPKAKERRGFGAWTPKGFDWVFRTFVSTEKGSNYSAVLAKPFENKHVPDDYYEGLKQSYDERFYKQEALGEYLNQFSGAAYYNFSRTENVQKLEFDPAFPLCWSLDFNIDPMCSVLSQLIDTTTREQAFLGKRTSRVHVLDELVLPDTRTIQACGAFLKRITPFLEQGLRAIRIYGDASGNNRHSSSRESDWQIVREFLKRETNLHVAYNVPAANPAVRDRVTAVCSSLLDASGDRKILVDPRCRELIQDFEEIAWMRDSRGNSQDDIDKRDPKRTHVSDAFGYFIYDELGIYEKGGPRREVIV